MNQMIRAFLTGVMLCTVFGCESPTPSVPYDYLTTYRRPSEMKTSVPTTPYSHARLAPAPISTQEPEGDKPEIPLRRPLSPQPPAAPVAEGPKPTPDDIINGATGGATQHPSQAGFINAVQFYHFQEGALYEIMTAPGFLTILRLRPGEDLQHLAAGDTSRWLIDIIGAGNADSNANGLWPSETQPESGRVCVLIKPRFPGLKTNLIIATNERTYMIDLKSSEETYHSAVEWTYPQPPTVLPSPTKPAPPAVPVDDRHTRNFLYSLQAPARGLPPWAPEAVYDDGHRVYVQFHSSINDVRRPPLYLLDSDGTARMVNYRTEPNRYVVDELFDRAALRIGNERVVIERILPRPAAPSYVRNGSFSKE